jgi:hypothetical protein
MQSFRAGLVFLNLGYLASALASQPQGLSAGLQDSFCPGKPVVHKNVVTVNMNQRPRLPGPVLPGLGLGLAASGSFC